MRATPWLLRVAAMCACVVSLAARQTASVSSADTLVADAVRQAALEHKGVIVVFGASWCMPCRDVDAFLNSPDASRTIGRHYLLRHLTIFEREDKIAFNTPGGESLFNRLAGNGIPLIAFFDAGGRTVGIWNDGLPDQAGRAKFLKLFIDNAPNLAIDARETMATSLKHGLGVYTISGLVTDERLQPANDVDVSVVSSTYRSGGQHIPVWGPHSKTDETGRYSIEGATGGEYQVVVNSTTASGVLPVTLRPREDREGVNLRLAPARPVGVRGIAVRSDGQAIAHRNVTLVNLDHPTVTYHSVTGGDGAFSLDARAGRYNATVTVPSPSAPGVLLEAAMRPLLIVDAPIDGLKLTAEPAGALSGTLTIDGGQMTSAERAAIRVVAVAVEPEPGTPSNDVKVSVGNDGRFTLRGLFGPRVLRVAGLPAGWKLASARINTTNAETQPTDFTGLPIIDGAKIAVARGRR
jgi:thiol-disulfide isomerase/thioredoxin